MASKWSQPVNLHSDWDLLGIAIGQMVQPGDGQHFLVHWLTDTGGNLFYSDVMDVCVQRPNLMLGFCKPVVVVA